MLKLEELGSLLSSSPGERFGEIRARVHDLTESVATFTHARTSHARQSNRLHVSRVFSTLLEYLEAIEISAEPDELEKLHAYTHTHITRSVPAMLRVLDADATQGLYNRLKTRQVRLDAQNPISRWVTGLTWLYEDRKTASLSESQIKKLIEAVCNVSERQLALRVIGPSGSGLAGAAEVFSAPGIERVECMGSTLTSRARLSDALTAYASLHVERLELLGIGPYPEPLDEYEGPHLDFGPYERDMFEALEFDFSPQTTATIDTLVLDCPELLCTRSNAFWLTLPEPIRFTNVEFVFDPTLANERARLDALYTSLAERASWVGTWPD